MSKRFILPTLAFTLALIVGAINPAAAAINTSGSLNAFTACSGTASVAQSFTVSGTALTGNLAITTPTGFEVSLSNGTQYTDSLSLTPTSGTVNNTTIYVRLSASATGKPSGDISCSSVNATTQNIDVSGSISSISLSVASQNNVSCNGGSNGTATISATGGIGSMSYIWSPSGGTAAMATGLAQGTYICSVTDKNGCSQTQNVSITEPAAITGSTSAQTNVTCYGGYNGSSTISASGGTGTLNYYWSPFGGTTSSDSGLAAGTYTCFIGDQNDCSTRLTVIITQPPVISTSIFSQINVSCYGDSNGTATISASGGMGGFTYSWSSMEGTTVTASALPAGSFTCTVTDQAQCSVSQAIEITQPVMLVVNDSIAPITCFGGTNGGVYTNVSGGTANYSYRWNNDSTSKNLTGLGLGTFSVSVTDHNGCTAQSNAAAITQPTPYIITIDSVRSITCQGGNNGAIYATVTGETPTYNYSWTGGSHNLNATNVTAGNYTLTVTDQNECSATASAQVSYLHELPSVTFNPSFETACLNSGTQTLTGELPTGGIFSGTGVEGNLFNPSTTGTDSITYTYTDNNGCTNKATAGIIVSVCEGIQEVADGSISLYPNPATSVVNLKTDGIRGKLLLQIYDNLGQLVREINGPVLTGSDVTSVNVEDLVPAHYFVRVTAGETMSTFNIIVQR